jgi:Chlamydia polymorphic membrane protein (Chlamydia_PMP) repeat
MCPRERRLKKKRRLRRQLASGTGVTLGATLLVGGTAQAACTCTVDSLADPTDAGHTTLRDAITSAEANAGLDTITFASGLSGTITLGSELPTISDALTISGPGASALAISGNDSTRILHLNGSAGFPVTISGLTLTHGKGSAGQGGGAINSYNAGLTLSGTVLSYNNMADGGGGAIYAYSSFGFLTIEDSTLSGNTAGGGGAIYAVGQGEAIRNSTFTGNHAVYRGGAIGVDDPTGPTTIVNSTLTGNMSTGNATGSRGGAIYVYGAEGGVALEGSTVAGNSARDGGGIFNLGAFSSPPVAMYGSIVANNTASLTGPDLGHGPFTSQFSLLESISGAAVSDTVPGSDITGQDPQIGGLASNGGPTQTMKPAITSPAVDRGRVIDLTADQRGQPRPFDLPSVPNSSAPGADGSDMGAVELQPSDVPAPAVSAKKKKKCKRKKHKRSVESAKKKKCKKKKRR